MFRILCIFLFIPCTDLAIPHSNEMSHLEMAAQRRAENIHRIDSIILLTYISVLVVIVLTSWLFKHYRFMFVHETGLTLFYGLLIGFVIRYFDIGLLQSQTFDVVLKDRRVAEEPPDYLRLEVGPVSGPHVSFYYELMEGFYADKKKHNEQKIEQKVVVRIGQALGIENDSYLIFERPVITSCAGPSTISICRRFAGQAIVVPWNPRTVSPKSAQMETEQPKSGNFVEIVYLNGRYGKFVDNPSDGLPPHRGWEVFLGVSLRCTAEEFIPLVGSPKLRRSSAFPSRSPARSKPIPGSATVLVSN